MNRSIWVAAAAAFGSLRLPFASSARVSPAQAQVDALEGLFGKQPTFRRSQTKGLCASGHFIGSASGRALSGASVFSGGKVPVVARPAPCGVSLGRRLTEAPKRSPACSVNSPSRPSRRRRGP